MTAGTLDLEPMRIGGLMDWWLVLRSLLDERPVHTSGAVDLPDDLRPQLHPGRRPRAELRAYLDRAGYLHLRGVYTPDEMQRISDDMDAAEPSTPTATATAGGPRWPTAAAGWCACSGSTTARRPPPRCSTTTACPPSAACPAAATPSTGRAQPGRGPVQAPRRRQGISDVPWHKDCSLGRHSYECCSLTIGISVTGAGPTSGQLRVVPGSHRALVWPSLFDASALDLPDVALPTETGDVTRAPELHAAHGPAPDRARAQGPLHRLPAPAPGRPTAAETGRRRLRGSPRERTPHHQPGPRRLIS